MRSFERIAIALLVVASSVRVLTGGQHSDVLQSLGVSTTAAHDSVLNSFFNGKIVLAGTRAVFLAASPEQREILVRGAIAAARAYTATADFAARYAALRETQRPERAAVPQNGEEAQAAQMKQLEAVAKEALKLAENMTPQAREDLIENIEFTKRQLAELNKDPKHRAAVDAAAREAAKVAAEEFARATAQFETDYPSDVRQLLTTRLRAFLTMSATVDFSAKLIEKDNKKLQFVDPTFESMPREWKMLYRAGKPSVDAARVAAQEWLKALEGK
jgi:hypothetical protein